MILPADVIKIGKIRGPHGIRGEMEMMITDDVFDQVDTDYVFLKIDGLLVPFFLEEYRFKNDEVVYIHFEDVKSEDDAQRFCGSDVYFPLSLVPKKRAKQPLTWKYLTGFCVVDETVGRIGVVESVDDSSANILLMVQSNDGRDVLVPIHPDLITACDEKKRILTLHLPDGLLNLNS